MLGAFNCPRAQWLDRIYITKEIIIFQFHPIHETILEQLISDCTTFSKFLLLAWARHIQDTLYHGSITRIYFNNFGNSYNPFPSTYLGRTAIVERVTACTCPVWLRILLTSPVRNPDCTSLIVRVVSSKLTIIFCVMLSRLVSSAMMILGTFGKPFRIDRRLSRRLSASLAMLNVRACGLRVSFPSPHLPLDILIY